MGEIIYLAEGLADRSRPSLGPARFFFALECPLSYLAAERIERVLGEIEWVPVIGALGDPELAGGEEQREALAVQRLTLAHGHADRLGLPIVELHDYPMDSRRASRVAVFASENERVRQYALAMARLTFCGGFDLDDPNVIAEAAAVAGLDAGAALEASENPELDFPLDATSRGLSKRGVGGAPAIRIGTSWFEGADPLLNLAVWSQFNMPPA